MWPMRLRMVDDLLARKRLDGLSRAEVLELLGPPAGETPEARELRWLLGPARAFLRIDGEWLWVAFDGDGRVARAWTAPD